MASPAYLAALRASMQPNVINMPVQGDVDPNVVNMPVQEMAAPPVVQLPGYKPTLGQSLAGAGLSMPSPEVQAAMPSHAPGAPVLNLPVQGDVSPGTDPILDRMALPDAHRRGAIDPGVSLANAGVQSMPTGVGAELPKPPPAASKPGGGPIGYDPSKTAGGEAAPQPTGIRINMGAGGGGGRGVDMRAALQPFEDEKAAVRAQTSAEQKLGEDAAVAAGLRGQELAQQEAAVRKHAEMADRDVAQRMDKIESLTKEVSEGKINPDHFWESRSTGQKIAFGVAAFLGGFVSGFRGGPNEALQHMESAIDRDMAAQRANIENKRGQIGDMRGLLAETYRRYGNMDQAEAAARVIALQQIDQRAQEYAVGSGNELVAAKGQMLQAQINKAEADARARLAAAGSGGNGAQLKRLQDLTQENMKQGDDLATAQKRAIATLGLADVGNVGAYGRKSGDKPSPAEEAALEAKAAMAAISKADPKAVAAGGGFGNTYAQVAPAWAPGAEEAINNRNARGSYNNNVKLGFAAAWRMRTGGMEPKNPHLIDEMVEPYLINPTDSPSIVAKKKAEVERLIAESAVAQGATVDAPASAAPVKPPPGFQGVK